MGRNTTVYKIDYDEFVNIFNTEGKEHAKRFVEEKYGGCYERIQRIVSKESKYFYNRNLRKYEEKPPAAVDAEFMSIDALYKGKNVEKSADIRPVENFTPPPTMDEIMMDMIKDRVLELSRFITIDHYSNKIVIKSKLIQSSGYQLILT